VNHLTALPILADYFESLKLDDITVVSPDVGRVKVCKKLADMLGAELAIMHKGRPQHNVAEITHVIGEVAGRTCIVADDMIDTAGSVSEGAKALINAGAKAHRGGADHRAHHHEHASGPRRASPGQDPRALRGPPVRACHPERLR
jgi:phosphoribosylpyrophosphate synthetase